MCTDINPKNNIPKPFSYSTTEVRKKKRSELDEVRGQRVASTRVAGLRAHHFEVLTCLSL
jgi:hypothetical protein